MDKNQNIKKVYSAFIKAGFSPNQAKALTAEVGRENAYQSKYIFGHHTDMANSADNLGFFSWQGERKKNLLNKLQQKGLYVDGKIKESQDALDTMAEFAKEEMQNISSYKKTKEGFLNNPNISQQEAAELLGRNYLRWDMDGKYIKNVAEHKKRRDKYYSQISGEPYVETDNSVATSQSQQETQPYIPLDFNLPEMTGMTFAEEEKETEEKPQANKREENANKLSFISDVKELQRQQEQAYQPPQFLEQQLVEGVAYQPIQQNFQEGGYYFQKGGTWSRQQQALKAEKDAKLKKLLEQEKPVYKKKTFDEKLAEKRQEQETKVVVKDNTATRNYNDATKHSNVARNKTDREIAEERKAIREKSDANVLNSWSLDAFKPSNYTRENIAEMAQGLESKFRVSDEPNFFDDYLNPANMIGGMASNLGQAPLQAEQTNSYMPYVTAVGTPLAVGAMAGYGTQNTGQFVNNLANPLAGIKNPFKKNQTIDFDNYLTQEQAVQARAERMIAQQVEGKKPWVGQNNKELTTKFQNAVENHNPASDYSGNRIGVNSGGMSTEISRHPLNHNQVTPGHKLYDPNAVPIYLNDANKARVAAHETGHYYRNSGEEADEWLSLFDFSKLPVKEATYLRGNKPTAIYQNQITENINNGINLKSRGTYHADEIRERAAQLKDYIAQKNGIPLNEDFVVTKTQLNDAIKNYVKDTGLDNTMTPMLKSLKDKEGLLKLMNKYALGVAPIAGATYLGTQEQEPPKYQLGGIKIDPQGYWNPENLNKPVIIPSSSISMKNVDFSVIGTSVETGEQKLMQPNKNYFFKNTQNVLEQPVKY